MTIDLDGTLVDTAAEIAEAANRTLREAGLPAQDPQLITGFIGAGGHALMRQLLAHLRWVDDAAVEALLQRFDVHYGQTAGSMARPYPGCDEALARLTDAGLVLVCVTNKEQRHALRVLEATGLRTRFELVIGGDSLPQRKPDPAVLAHVWAVVGGGAASTLHLGDSETDVDTARRSGVPAWAVRWGYNGGRPIEQAAPDRVFDSWAQIAEQALALRALRPVVDAG